ncbi:MAG TPA: SDR family oxidoreductase [Methylomirabilota bacterium]
MRLKDRVAIVTGAASGIGAASALAMAREGARVLVVDLDEAGAKATVAQIERAGGLAAAAPVATHTPMLPTFMNRTAVDAESLQQYEATVPLGRLNQPEDLAATAVFLASDDAAMITGSCVEVDGGRCI